MLLIYVLAKTITFFMILFIDKFKIGDLLSNFQITGIILIIHYFIFIKNIRCPVLWLNASISGGHVLKLKEFDKTMPLLQYT